MTSAERRRLRQALDNLGFKRTGHTDDHGDGMYSERWARVSDGSIADCILIEWGPREAATPPLGTCTATSMTKNGDRVLYLECNRPSGHPGDHTSLLYGAWRLTPDTPEEGGAALD